MFRCCRRSPITKGNKENKESKDSKESKKEAISQYSSESVRLAREKTAGKIRELEERLAKGNTNSDDQYTLAQYYSREAIIYSNGMGALKDSALKYFLLAAEQGHVRAQLALATIYGGFDFEYYAMRLKGPKDQDKAIEWLRRAADQGSALALDKLGHMYAGEAKKDIPLALKYLELAATAGNYEAQKKFAEVCMKVTAVSLALHEQAIKFLLKAVEYEQEFEYEQELKKDHRNGYPRSYLLLTSERSAAEILEKYYQYLTLIGGLGDDAIINPTFAEKAIFYLGSSLASRATSGTDISRAFNRLAETNRENIFDTLLMTESPSKIMQILSHLTLEVEMLVRERIARTMDVIIPIGPLEQEVPIKKARGFFIEDAGRCEARADEHSIGALARR